MKSVTYVKRLKCYLCPDFTRPGRSLSTFRLSTFGLLLTFNFALITIQCGLDIEDPTPPLPPIWVEKSLPEEWPERGIDAHESGGIFMEWESKSDADIATYYLYRAIQDEWSDSIGDFTLISQLVTNTSPVMNFIDREVKFSTKYSYKLRAESSSGSLSDYSDSVFYVLLPPIEFETMVPNGQDCYLSNNRALFWQNELDMQLEDYCLTILGEDNRFILRIILAPSNFIGVQESWVIPESTILSNGRYKWRIDFGAQYFQDKESAGSESSWAVFRITE